MSWHELGEEPDYRFSLANERTFLAWIRTALALMAAAVATTVLRPSNELRPVLIGIGLTLSLVAVLTSALTYSRWAENQRAMRLNQALPRPRILLPVCVTMTLIGVLVVVMTVAAS
ncbi:YidH family protein [Streptomyces tubercidicus]|uniref:YidH family protein n=1 Tax=Streptomyces tubercidicus TaxID=47759 RepID=UPI0036BDFC7D